MARWILWEAELLNPTPEERRADRSTEPREMSGYWRSVGPRTGYDMPVAIWTEANPQKNPTGATIFQRGTWLNNTIEDVRRWEDFIDKGWLKSVAVSREEWSKALDTGFWSDGKPAREMTDEEKLGIDVKPGSNNAPISETLSEQIAELVERANGLPEPKTQAEADAATIIVDKLRKLWKLADQARDTEKRPIDEQAKAVQVKWLHIMDPAKDAGAALDERRKTFLKKEQQRLDDIAAEENRKRQEEARRAQLAERERLQKIADEDAARENERRRIEAEEKAEKARAAQEAAAKDAAKQAEADRLAADAKAAEEAAAATVVAEEVAAPEIVVAEVQAERATAGGAFTRNSGLKATKVAVVTDPLRLVTHFIESADTDFTDYLTKRAAAALRGKITLPGVTVKDELK